MGVEEEDRPVVGYVFLEPVVDDEDSTLALVMFLKVIEHRLVTESDDLRRWTECLS